MKVPPDLTTLLISCVCTYIYMRNYVTHTHIITYTLNKLQTAYRAHPASGPLYMHIEDRAEGLTWALTALYSTAYRAHTASGPSCVHIEDRAEGLTWALTALYSTAYRAHTASGPSCVHIEDRATKPQGLAEAMSSSYKP